MKLICKKQSHPVKSGSERTMKLRATTFIIDEHTRHCQLHGDPYQVPASKYLRLCFKVGRAKTYSDSFSPYATNEELETVLRGHPTNYKGDIEWLSEKEFKELVCTTSPQTNP